MKEGFPSNQLETKEEKKPGGIDGFISKFDELIGQRGISRAIREEIEKRGGKISVNFESEAAREALEKEATLLIGTHPNRVEALLTLAGLPERDSLRFLGNAFFNRMGENFKKFLIPVYVSRPARYFKKFFRDKIGLDSNMVSSEEAHRKNKESTNEAARVIREGGELVIFPERNDQERSWYPGVGFIAEQLRDTDANIVFSYVQGDMSKFKMLTRLIPGVRDKIELQSKVIYSNPIRVNEILSEGLGGKDLAQRLENRYKEWVANLSVEE